MRAWYFLLLFGFSVTLFCCVGMKKPAPGAIPIQDNSRVDGFRILTDQDGHVIGLEPEGDTVSIDLSRTRYLKIRGRVYPLPSNAEAAQAELDSIYTKRSKHL